ncbi:MAG TPA: RsmB/NOP family class I SAM-dependent RNA methyltransferase [Brevundimonas sp.]|uniref:RsmB/NOP family class I SAM-dependent RNA methyltransferase n=1 Tax=Brevundimonas sp. TaxID=1871086 RepID=UPI002604AD5F|nr:RsmB/NOP family class I SAM-dependent RNA methyltransferase [Brevundimonas sp.]HRO32693.1 RsmB/NOP family class I SAM-dependent RNA methyltransferase [Brevundimonas sp.]
MTPAARLAAAASVLDSIAQGRQPAEAVLKAWGQANRYAGSKDRKAIADRVYKVLRARARLSWAMGGREDGRALVIGSLSLIDGLALDQIEALHSGDGYGPRPLSKQERSRLTAAGEGDLPGWVAAGLPAFVVEDFKATFGDRWAEEAQGLMAPRAPIDLRVNTLKADVEAVRAELAEAGLEATPTPGSPVGLRLASEPPPNIQATDAFKDGRIEIQDEGSQIVCALAGAAPGMTVVDYCAGGGGKTLGLAAMMFPSPLAGEGVSQRETDGGAVGDTPDHPADETRDQPPHPSGSAAHLPPRGGKGRLIASDVVQKRLDNIRPRLARAGVEADLRLLGQNGGGMEDLNGQADLVFVDAPCSGSGTWRRRPEDAWRLTADEVARLHALQVRILGQAAKLVRPGGRLIYVTCSMLAAENEASADAFEAAHPDFRPVALDHASAVGHRLRLSPASTDTDGFFAALYERSA